MIKTISTKSTEKNNINLHWYARVSIHSNTSYYLQANEYLGSGDSADRRMLIKKKADWAVKINEPR